MKRKNKNTKKLNLNKIEEKVYHLLQQMGKHVSPQTQVDKYNVDFLIDKKYIIECYGDFWHCNPTQYTSTYYNRGVKKTAQEIWSRDERRRKSLQDIGYKFLCLWESEINNNFKAVRSKIKKFLGEQNE